MTDTPTPCTAWLNDGGPDLWFLDNPQGNATLATQRAHTADTEQAKAICYGCPARDACLQLAINENHTWGIWGGTTPNERAATPLACEEKRGTVAGRQRHRRAGQKPCEECRIAWTENKREARARA